MPRAKTKRASSPSLIDKKTLARETSRIIRYRDLTQTEAARIVRDAPSQLSLVSTGNLEGFSPERLIGILTKFGRDIEIRIGRAKGATGKVRLSVK
jgi:predicted XRE-type DNA-binding protein